MYFKEKLVLGNMEMSSKDTTKIMVWILPSKLLRERISKVTFILFREVHVAFGELNQGLENM